MKKSDPSRHKAPGSVGLVETKYFTFAEKEPMKLASGKTLKDLVLEKNLLTEAEYQALLASSTGPNL